MGADQLAAITPAITELVAAAKARTTGYEGLCATFSVTGNAIAWAQVMDGTVNFGFPGSKPPLAFMASSGLSLPDLRLVEFEAGVFATFEHGACAPEVIARFVDAALIALHGLPPDSYAVTVTMKRF